jgi:hypothetical protein
MVDGFTPENGAMFCPRLPSLARSPVAGTIRLMVPSSRADLAGSVVLFTGSTRHGYSSTAPRGHGDPREAAYIPRSGHAATPFSRMPAHTRPD